MSKKVKPVLTAAIVRELLAYDPHDGSFVWKERRQEWFKSERSCKIWNKRYANKPAGGINTNKDGHCFLLIRIFGKSYTAAQLAFLYMTGTWPNERLVYVDGNSLNIRIHNLLDNMHGRGKRIYANNRSGVTGVSWNKSNKRWVASPMLEGKLHYLGSFTDFSEAEEVVSNFYRENGYLPHHGKERAA